MKDLTLGLCQFKVTKDKNENILTALKYIEQAASKGCNIIALPEVFNCPYDNKFFHSFSEEEHTGETLNILKKAALDFNVYIIGGSIIERECNKLYNTSYIFSPEGKIIDKHRKVHLFDIDIPNKITFKESDTLTPGDKLTVIDTPYCKIGIAICYDMRFPEMFKKMALLGAELIIIPAAFNMTTGPAHWDLTLRSRALDNQVFIAAISPARDTSANYVAYGHSLLASPWGDIVSSLDEKPGLLVCKLDSKLLCDVREQLPLLKHSKKAR
ncbi:carbon-nitrogen hydrolase family protein [Oceanirhabdus sp. W0125-5]|uniref:carbon-nitrogen hydrolase family protein n=1 Tax=Oceanirhabdus sp. W0125-5 TaxID=2999116 RepID=UPI0022F348D0|nr:carbon-nitrogen hydrolase family protein [Oceanirhabdus sp. W0125-5]WBW98274.1 carbon-nitrogen hydrolase family protein [Oceanirhabdus sp. W0125-5]